MIRETIRKAADGPIDWLVAVIVSWIIPLNLAGRWPVTYGVSLLLWIVPILCVLPRFIERTHRGSRRRRAVVITVLYIAGGGAVLDIVLGGLILRFSGREAYWLPIPAIGGEGWIPIEELLFYISGGIAIVLVYFWADEFWLHCYNTRQREDLLPSRGRLLQISLPSVTTLALLIGAGVLARRLYQGDFAFPAYYTFLACVAFAPAIVLFRAVNHFVNWRAFSFTALYVLLTACLWEVTLGLPKRWWGYRPEGMIGKYVDAWGTAEWPYPIEALAVWLVVTFSCVLTYEAIKAYHYDPRPPRQRLIGP